ncbi:MAG TPA: hypothetical protein VGV64_03270 [Thermoplasmata archaeon]|nr:hypothetical protein [Thermoplasmata archaeon]
MPSGSLTLAPVSGTALAHVVAPLARSILPKATAGSGAVPYGTNSSPLGIDPAIVGSAPIYGYLQSGTYDPFHGLLYVPSGASFDQVSVINGTRIVKNLTIGQYTETPGYDPVNHFIYVPVWNGNLSIWNGTTLVKQFTIGGNLERAVYDSDNGLMYVLDYGSTSLHVVRNTTVIANITVASQAYAGVYDPIDRSIYIACVGGAVDIVQGLSVIGTITANVPNSVAFDPLNGFVYVADSTTNSVMVINGTKLVTTLTSNGAGSLAVDTRTGWLYSASLSGGQITVVNGTKILTNLTVAASGAVAYDSGDGLIYATDADNLSTFSRTTLVHHVPAGGQIEGMTYDPSNGRMYAFVYGTPEENVTAFATVLSVGRFLLSPGGNPVGSRDVGQRFNLSATVSSPGVGPLGLSLSVAPGAGLGCQLNSTQPGGDAGEIAAVSCLGTGAGTYSVRLTITDHLSNSVSAWANLTVYPDPSAAMPTASTANGTSIPSSEIGENVTFHLIPSGGSGTFGAIRWTGLPSANCFGTTTLRPSCTIPFLVILSIQASFVDGNGYRATSPALTFHVYPRLTVLSPVVSRAAADTGQNVSLSVPVAGGTGTYVGYDWFGLPVGDCSMANPAVPLCQFNSPASLTISVSVTDSGGVTVASPTTPIDVSGLPSAAPPAANRSVLDVGQSVHWNASATGGLAPYSFTWRGLPSNCIQTNVSALDCTALSDGTMFVSVIAVDGNGGVSLPSATTTVTVLSDPRVAAPTVSAPVVPPGGTVRFTALPTDGSGPYTLRWLGLPPECPSSSMSPLSCTARTPGTYQVSVVVTDSLGFEARSPGVSLLVEPSGGGSSTFSIGGLPPLAAGAIVAVAAIAALAAFAIVRARARRARPRRRPPSPTGRGRAGDPPAGPA